jgi:hypothetical protein
MSVPGFSVLVQKMDLGQRSLAIVTAILYLNAPATSRQVAARALPDPVYKR